MSTPRNNQVGLPEYRPASFHALKKLLGESDSGLEWLEVAVRELIQRHESDGAEATEKMATHHGIKVNDLKIDDLRRHWARLQIISVAQYLEYFLDSFRTEFPREVRQRKNKEDLVTFTLDVYGTTKVAVGELQCDLLTYYRKARNFFVHDPSAESPKMLARQADALKEKIVASSNPYSHLAAPNAPDQISFDDFVLFTRALKDFSKRLCACVFPTTEELQAAILTDAAIIHTLRKQNLELRRCAVLANYLRQRFGFHATAEALATDLLKTGLLAQR